MPLSVDSSRFDLRVSLASRPGIDLTVPSTSCAMGALEGLSVRHLPTEHVPGALNMALDAVAGDTAATEGIASVRVYGWDPSTLSLGYAQDPSTIDWEFCEREGIKVTRRPTGGGAIYHDNVGDISYSIVAPADALPGNLMDCYRLLCEPIEEAFARMGVDVSFIDEERPEIHQPACYLRELHPSHDLVVTAPSGEQKISGNAQYRRRSAVIQHGSLTYRVSPERHLGCFTDHQLDAGTFRDRVTGIQEQSGITRQEAIDCLESTLREWSGASAEQWTDTERERAESLATDKFHADEWVIDRTDPRDVST